MWINLDSQQLEYVKGAMLAFAEGNERDAKLFWTEEMRELRERLEQEANDYRAIAEKIEQSVTDFVPADPYRLAAQEKAHDELEIDEDAIVSRGDDPGAWVHAWIWITDDEAGAPSDEDEDENEDELCEVCGEPLDEAGDGWDCKCADCADKDSKDTYPENWTKDDG